VHGEPGRDAFGDLDPLSLLAEPARRRLYRHLSECGRPMGRDELARATGIGRSLAAYHLDKLAEHGLLEVDYARPAGRSGPGAGRPAKLYRRSEHEFVAGTPPRDYRLLAELLAWAATGDHGAIGGPVADAARKLGRSYGEAARGHRATLDDVLRARGYEPIEAQPGELRLRNCPFDAVAARHPAVVCGLNLTLLQGLLEGLGDEPSRAALAPSPGACCVVIRT
jgi:predicted ArsR family transcriptional regulator